MTDLKPCPFCGSGTKLVKQIEGRYALARYSVSCNGCGLVAFYEATEAEAIAAWNARAERTCRIETRNGNQYCTRCGEMVGTWDIASELYVSGNMVEMWNYCPNCGARVIGTEAVV